MSVKVCGPKPGVDGKRAVHACFKTQGLPVDWEAANDGRWMHVQHGDQFAARIEQVTCRACLGYIERDKEVGRES